MTDFTEQPVIFTCGNDRLLAVLHQPEVAQKTGVVIVVGGPQYRVGSHRQFVLLARFLAANGVPVFRFDVRGMGDSDGAIRSFDQVGPDIKSAIDAFIEASPGVERVLLWGLCDAASAILFYARQDPRVNKIILLNPWVRTETGLARAYMRHYYLDQLWTRDFWKRIFGGDISLLDSIKRFIFVFKQSRKLQGRQGDMAGYEGGDPLLPEKMRAGLAQFNGRVQIILSGEDITASEFRDLIEESKPWQSLLNRKQVEIHCLEGANHTFSKTEWRNRVAQWTLDWARE